MFPGQGSQKAGMASEFHSNFKIVRDIFEKVDEALKFNLSKIIIFWLFFLSLCKFLKWTTITGQTSTTTSMRP